MSADAKQSLIDYWLEFFQEFDSREKPAWPSAETMKRTIDEWQAALERAEAAEDGIVELQREVDAANEKSDEFELKLSQANQQVEALTEQLRWREYPAEKPNIGDGILSIDTDDGAIVAFQYAEEGNLQDGDKWLPIPTVEASPIVESPTEWECDRCGDKWPSGLLFCPNKHESPDGGEG